MEDLAIQRLQLLFSRDLTLCLFSLAFQNSCWKAALP